VCTPAEKGDNMIKDCKCRYCGKWFHHLGIARHETMHLDKRKREKEDKLKKEKVNADKSGRKRVKG